MHLLSFKNSLTRCIELISSPRNGPDRSIHKNKTQSDSELQKSSKILEQFEQVTENAGECHRCGTLQLLGCKSTACRVTRTQCLRLQHNIERHLQYPSRWRLHNIPADGGCSSRRAHWHPGWRVHCHGPICFNALLPACYDITRAMQVTLNAGRHAYQSRTHGPSTDGAVTALSGL